MCITVFNSAVHYLCRKMHCQRWMLNYVEYLGNECTYFRHELTWKGYCTHMTFPTHFNVCNLAPHISKLSSSSIIPNSLCSILNSFIDHTSNGSAVNPQPYAIRKSPGAKLLTSLQPTFESIFLFGPPPPSYFHFVSSTECTCGWVCQFDSFYCLLCWDFRRVAKPAAKPTFSLGFLCSGGLSRTWCFFYRSSGRFFFWWL